MTDDRTPAANASGPPSLDEVVGELSRLAEEDVDPSYSVRELGIDSLVLAEWIFEVEERLNVAVADDDRLETLLDLPIARVYEELLVLAGYAPGLSRE